MLSAIPRCAVPAAIVLAMIAAQPSMGTAASSAVAVSVPSATTLDPANCLPNQAGRTSLGTVLPDSTIASTIDCSVRFGSTNHVATLRIAQADGWSTAMGQDTFASTGTGASTTTDGFTSSTPTSWWAVSNGNGVRH